jgi:ABC-2 type transport system ATP-binding protein
MNNTLELRHVTKHYNKFVAVDDLSLNIEKGSVFGLLGPNGAGKTSSIRMMMGITMPDTGEVIVFGARTSIASVISRRNAASTRR